MDTTYLKAQEKKPPVIIILVIIVTLVILGGLYFWFKGRSKLVSPVPAEPDFEVIFYTPTPSETLPTSTPSATPKVKQVASPTPQATTPTVKKTASPSATVKASPKATATPTVKISVTP